jgi:hypothetical protein
LRLLLALLEDDIIYPFRLLAITSGLNPGCQPSGEKGVDLFLNIVLAADNDCRVDPCPSELLYSVLPPTAHGDLVALLLRQVEGQVLARFQIL